MHERGRARAHAYTYVCARGLPAYFGILIARGRPSPLPLSLPPPRSSRSLALRPISPRLASYRAPAPRLHPRGHPVARSPRVSPLETSPIPKNLGSTRQPPVTRILTCADCTVCTRRVAHERVLFFQAVSPFPFRYLDWISSASTDALISRPTRIRGNLSRRALGTEKFSVSTLLEPLHVYRAHRAYYPRRKI